MKLTVVAIAAAVVGSTLLARVDATANDPVVELPKFVVTDSRELPPPESWRYGTMPGFEILSNASDKATQRLLRDFDMFRQALGYIWPQPARLPQTTSLILCGKRNKFDGFIPANRYKPDAGFVSVFLKKDQQTAIVIDLQATTLNVLNVDGADDAATGTDSGLISVDHDKQLYREYVRFILSRSEPRLPAWFEEGLSQIIMRMEFDKRWIVYAKLEDPNTVSTQAAMTAQLNALSGGEDADSMALPGAPAEDRDFNAALRRKALVPFEKFFAVAHDSSEATNVLGNNVWAKQAYAFVHMCLYGMNGKYQKQFSTFLQRLAREPASEELFKQAFGKTYKQMLMELRGYIEFTVYQSKEYRSKEDAIIPPAPLALRDATQSEVGRIKGEAMVLAGREKEARAELVAPYQRGERDPYLLAALGLYEKNYGEEARARKFLEAAFVGKAKRPEACLELARFRLVDALKNPAGEVGKLSPPQTVAVLAPLILAHGKTPVLPALYDLAGETWVRSTVKPTKEDAKLMIEGAQLFPTKLKLVFQAGVMARDAGEVRSAHALADHGIHYAPDANVKQRFEALKASLPPAPAEPAVAAPAATGAAPAGPAAKPAPKK